LVVQNTTWCLGGSKYNLVPWWFKIQLGALVVQK